MTQPDQPTTVPGHAQQFEPGMPYPQATPEVLPPVPVRRRGTGLIVVGVVAVVLLVGAGVAAAVALNPAPHAVAAPLAVSPSPSATASPRPRPAATDYTGPLKPLVLAKPSAAVLTPNDRVGDPDGNLSMKQLAEEFQGSEAFVLKRLTDLQYQRGVIVAWRDGTSTVYIQIVQFRTSPAAEGWNDFVKTGFVAPALLTSDPMADTETGRIYTTLQPNGDHGAHARFSRGLFAVEIDVLNPTAADKDAIRKMAADQLALLP